MDWSAVCLSLQLAASTMLCLAALGAPLAYWLAFSSWRGRFIVDAMVALPLILPPTVVGFYVLLLIGPQGMVGRLFHALGGGPLPFSFTGLLLASIIYNLPFTVRPFTAAFTSVDRRLLDAARCLGAGPLRTFATITVPLSWPGLLCGLVLTFAHAIGEFGVVLMVGGNIPGRTRTIAISVYDDLQSLDFAAANTTAAALLVFAFSVLCLTYALQRRISLV